MTEAIRCTNCGTPLMAEDTKCPACGAPVDADTLFPKPEEFVDVSYQNVDPEPIISEPVIIDTEPIGESTYKVDDTYAAPAGGNNTALRTCGITCGVLFVAGLCCLLSLAVVLWFTGDLIVNILRSIGINIY